MPHPAIRVLQTLPAEEATLGEAMAAEAATLAAEAMAAVAMEGAEVINDHPCIPRCCRQYIRFILVCVRGQFGIT